MEQKGSTLLEEALCFKLVSENLRNFHLRYKQKSTTIFTLSVGFVFFHSLVSGILRTFTQNQQNQSRTSSFLVPTTSMKQNVL